VESSAVLVDVGILKRFSHSKAFLPSVAAFFTLRLKLFSGLENTLYHPKGILSLFQIDLHEPQPDIAFV
jgi:hypothetical protein